VLVETEYAVPASLLDQQIKNKQINGDGDEIQDVLHYTWTWVNLESLLIMM
ncbi:28685_t:CDS:1, partial [Racocetra persica]